MFSSAEELVNYIAENDVRFVDVRFCDLPGVVQHFNLPAASYGVDEITEGLLFDGSSITGFQGIHESDMKLLADVASAFVDPYREAKTLVVTHSIVDPFTDEPYSRDPRQVAAKAEKYLQSTGIADTVYYGAEAEFYMFDSIRYQNTPRPQLLRDRLRRSGLEHRRRGAGRQPRLQDSVQGRLLPRLPAGQVRRHPRPDVDDARDHRLRDGARPP